MSKLAPSAGGPDARRLAARRLAARRLAGRTLAALILPAALLLLWQIASARGWTPRQILPPPKIVWASFLELAASGELPAHIKASLMRVAISFLAGSSAGLALGLGMGLSRRVEDLFSVVFHAINQVPTLGWLPVMIVIVGLNDTLSYILIAQAVFVSVAINTQRGLRQTPERLLEAARVFRLSRVQLLRKVILPSAAPQIFTGLRFGLANGWVSLVVVELLISSEGLGYLMSWGRQAFQLDLVIVAILVVGVIGWTLDGALARLEGVFNRWQMEKGFA
jgi:sulfonate transport system permease protein